jgi:hypothetical protein
MDEVEQSEGFTRWWSGSHQYNRTRLGFQQTDSVQMIQQTTLASSGSKSRRFIGIFLAVNISHRHEVHLAERYRACIQSLSKLKLNRYSV